MMPLWNRSLRLVGLLLVLVLPLLYVLAADHAEAPATRADPEADIADVYAWHDDTKLVAVITFAGGPVAGLPSDQPLRFDPRVLYTLHIDNDNDLIPDIDVDVRFGRNRGGVWGMRVENLPGARRPVVFGTAGHAFGAGGGLKVFGGLTDDPFFFDSQGFVETLTTGDVSFDSTRDTFAGLNVKAIVLEMDLAAASDGSDTIQVWASTGRLP